MTQGEIIALSVLGVVVVAGVGAGVYFFATRPAETAPVQTQPVRPTVEVRTSQGTAPAAPRAPASSPPPADNAWSFFTELARQAPGVIQGLS